MSRSERAGPRLLIAGEMGANFGHASKMAEVARALEGRAEVFLAYADPAALRALAPGLSARLLPAPGPRPARPAKSGRGPLGYPGSLLVSGWRDPRALTATAEAWRGLLELVRPDALAAQGAPGALLAARTTGTPTLLYGSGFDTPPRATPMPAFDVHASVSGTAPDPERAARAAAQEAEALASANAALAAFRAPPAAAFAELLRPEAAALVTFAEIDHYAPRAVLEPEHPPYLGQITTVSEGASAAWRPGARRRVLAYLRPEASSFAAILDGLAALGPEADVIVAAPGATSGGERGPVRVFPHLLRLDDLLTSADLGVSHGSNGVAAAFVMAGGCAPG